MKTRSSAILTGAVLLLLSVQPIAAEQKTETYEGFFQGSPCSVTINWANYSGQDAVDGKIITNGGVILTFFGSNPRSGYMEIEIQGRQHQLNKTKSGNSVSWSGQNLSFSRSTGGAVMPRPANNPSPARGFRKDYVGSWRGDAVTAYLNFVPDSDPDVLYTADGGIIKNGVAYSISAWQPRADYIELEIDTDGENHKLSKEVHSGRNSWVGRWVSLTENAAAAGIGGIRPPAAPSLPKPPTLPTLPATPTMPNPPTTVSPMPVPAPPAVGNAIWVIACEAQSSKASAEADAAAWRNRGFQSGVLWIPDYSSLSGANLWLTHVGRYDYRTGKAQGMADLKRVRQFYPDAYGIKVDQSGRRETF